MVLKVTSYVGKPVYYLNLTSVSQHQLPIYHRSNLEAPHPLKTTVGPVNMEQTNNNIAAGRLTAEHPFSSAEGTQTTFNTMGMSQVRS